MNAPPHPDVPFPLQYVMFRPELSTLSAAVSPPKAAHERPVCHRW